MEEISELINRIASGDRAAFSPLFERLWPIVHRFCSNFMRSDIDADDAAQEAMMKCFNQAASYDATRPALPWVLTIAAWECRTLMQKRKRRREIVDDKQPTAASNATFGDIMRRDLQSAVESALEHVSPDDRAVITAAFWQLSDESALASATQRKRRQRALERLRVVWRKLYGA